MKQRNQSRFDDHGQADSITITRRLLVGFSGLTVLGTLLDSAFGRENRDQAGGSGPPKEIQERMEQSRAFSERMRNASGLEEMRKIVEERSAWGRTRAVEELKGQLGVSDQEWAVIKPRLEAVYDLMHPRQSFGPANSQSMSPAERGRRELRELLNDKGAAADQVKTKLTALRAAKEKENQELAKAQQDLRKLMTLRREAVLVLNGMLD